MGINVHLFDTSRIYTGPHGPHLEEPSWWDAGRYGGDTDLISYIGSDVGWEWGSHELAYDGLQRPSDFNKVRTYLGTQPECVRERWSPLVDALEADAGLWLAVS